jgi:ABC-type glycerol-3-phosphate transport system substrate-binding protein
MKNLSVFHIVLLAIFGSFAIAGFLVFALLVSQNNSSSIGKVVIWGTLPGGVFQEVLLSASESDERLREVTYVEKDPVSFERELTEALASAQGPDIFILTTEYALRNAGRVYPIPYTALSQKDYKDTFVEASDPFLAVDGMLALPLLVDPLLLYANRPLLEEAGFAEPPRYWSELPALAAAVSKHEAGTVVRSAIAFGEYDNVDNAKDIIALLIQQAGGSITRTDATGRLTPALSIQGGGVVQPTESALRFFTEFSDPSKEHYSWSRTEPRSRAAFTGGTLALYLGYASEQPFIAGANPNLIYSVAPVPQPKERSVGMARVYGLAVSRMSANPNGALTIAALLVDSSLSASLSKAYGLPSARRAVISATIEGENQLYEREALIARSWRDPNPDATNQIFRDMLRGITTGAYGFTEAISRADQQIAQLISL